MTEEKYPTTKKMRVAKPHTLAEDRKERAVRSEATTLEMPRVDNAGDRKIIDGDGEEPQSGSRYSIVPEPKRKRRNKPEP